MLAIYPQLDPSYSTELWRAPDSSGVPDTSADEIIAVLSPGTEVYADIIGGDGPYHYRCRHVRPGATASGYTAWVVATPVKFTGHPPRPPLAPWVMYQSTEEQEAGPVFPDPPTAFVSLTLPAALMALRGTLRVTLRCSATDGGGGTKTLNVQVGGDSIGVISWGGGETFDFDLECQITNEGDTAVQSSWYRYIRGDGSVITSTADSHYIDTTQDQSIVIQVQVTGSGSTVLLHEARVAFLDEVSDVD